MSKTQKVHKRRSLSLDMCVSLLIVFVAFFVGLTVLSPKQTGFVGHWVVNKSLIPLFGNFIYLLPFLLVFNVVMMWVTKPEKRSRMGIGFAILYLLSPFVLTLQEQAGLNTHIGGWWGTACYKGLNFLFGKNGSWLVVIGLFLAAFICISPLSLWLLSQSMLKGTRKLLRWLWACWTDQAFWKSLFYSTQLESVEGIKAKKITKPSKTKKLDTLSIEKQITFERRAPKQIKAVKATPLVESLSESGYQLPSIYELEVADTSEDMIRKREALALEKSDILEEALTSFNVKAKVVHISAGPSVIRYELAPGDGVKISKITTLSQDIALKMAAPSVRIEAPIPGKSLVGIEVPAPEREAVFLRNIIEQTNFLTDKNILTSCLGLTITGEPVTFNLAEMPHLLIAGATGSGKSVCVNTIIMSILLRARPDQVKFVMIDPKKVELSLYDDIPHLLAPVVTNPQMAAATLKQWALREMEQRYELFSKVGVKDLAGYNNLVSDDPLPHVVVIIDELADLMMVASQEVENTICRLAQMARATGIHLVIATQRPSVNVVTGLIKANVPSRIAFFVQSQIDSRTILDVA